MFYSGGLTFDSEDPTKFVKIPNLIAAQRFGKSLLDRLGIYHSLSATGVPDQVLRVYLKLIEHDAGARAFKLRRMKRPTGIVCGWICLTIPPLPRAPNSRL